MSCLIRKNLPIFFLRTFHTTAQQNAARKGTREKARKKKVKVEIKKVGFIPHNVRNLQKLSGKRVSSRSVDLITEDPIDNVFFVEHYKTQSYVIEDVIKFYKEAYHPSLYNIAKAPLNVNIELNMVAEKKTRFVDAFSRHVALPHSYTTYGNRTVLAFCKTPEQVELCNKAGADLAGGTELVKKIQSGAVSLLDFKYVIGHPTVLPELAPIRGLLKKKFPSLKAGTLGPDMEAMLTLFKTGLHYTCEKDPFENDLGFIKTMVGTLDMETEQLVDNFKTLIMDIEKMRPKRAGDFVSWVWCLSLPSEEKFKVDFSSILCSKISENPKI